MRLDPPTAAPRSLRLLLFAASLTLALVACGKADDSGLSDDANQPPRADAGPNIEQSVDARVQLDGRASYDPDGSALQYHWSFDSVPEASALLEAESPFTDNHSGAGVSSFLPDAVGVYIVQLEVDDGVWTSDPAFVIVDVTAPEDAPVAEAGVDRSVPVGSKAVLDASQSYDPLGGTLSYEWTLAYAPDNSVLSTKDLLGATERVASFVPDVTGTYTATLVVDNGIASSAPDSVSITATGTDEGPVAVVVPEYTGEDCTAVPLDCTGSYDPEEDTLEYFWEVQVAPADSDVDRSSFDDPAAAATTLWADAAGDYIVSCSVYDGNSWSDPAEVALTLTERASNGAPDIWAGSDRTVALGEGECINSGGGASWDCDPCPAVEVELAVDGYAVDPDGDPLSIVWTVEDGDATLLAGDSFPGSALLSETTPDRPSFCTSDGYEFQLTVTDCPGEVAEDDLNLTGQCCGVQKTP